MLVRFKTNKYGFRFGDEYKNGLTVVSTYVFDVDYYSVDIRTGISSVTKFRKIYDELISQHEVYDNPILNCSLIL